MKRRLALLALLAALAASPFRSAEAGSTFLFDGETLAENWEKNWNDTEKNLWYAHLALQVADTLTTIHGLENGKGREANPVYGKHPSPERLVATKVIALWGVFSLMNDDTSAGEKETGLIVLNVLYSLVVLNNISIAYTAHF